MKRILLSLALMLLLLPGTASAVGTLEDTVYHVAGDLYVMRLTWTAGAGGVFDDATTSSVISGLVGVVVTNPGSTAPTDNYDIYLYDVDGVDFMGGTLANRDTAETEQVLPKVHADGTYTIFGSRPVYGKVLVRVSNNSVVSATGVIRIFFTKE